MFNLRDVIYTIEYFFILKHDISLVQKFMVLQDRDTDAVDAGSHNLPFSAHFRIIYCFPHISAHFVIFCIFPHNLAFSA